MKCVKVGTEIKRVKDSVAEGMVKSGQAVFASKKEWRQSDSEYLKRQQTNKKSTEIAEKKKNQPVEI
jgi:hypothetical protein